MILTSSVEVETLKQRNCDLEKEMELIENKLREMTSKYENLEVILFGSKTKNNVLCNSLIKGYFFKEA